jgi:hypothetical protein
MVATSSNHDHREFRPVLILVTADRPEAEVATSDDPALQTDWTRPGSSKELVADAATTKGVQSETQAGILGNGGLSNPGFSVDSRILPDTYRLDQNYPNPFNPTTSISYSVPRKTHIRIAVFDVLGREIAAVLDREHEPGAFVLRLDVTGLDLPSGIYLYRMTGEEFHAVRKMTVQR